MKHRLAVSFVLFTAGILSADIACARSAGRKGHNAPAVVSAVGLQDAEAKRSEIEWIKVLPAERLIDQDVVSADGRSLGHIDTIMLDVASGDAVYAMVSSGDDDLAIPFRALELRGWRSGGAIKVDDTYRRILRNSPRISGSGIDENLGDPKRIARTSRAFGVPTPYGYVVPPNPDRETLPNRYLLVRPRNIGALEARQDTRGADAARADEIRGRKVLHEGKSIGEVDYVMLDIEAGRIAYLLLSSGDFLGLGGEWIPVPPEAIAWPSDKETPVLKEGMKRSALKPLQRSELPGFVRRSHLEALYQRFDVKPYRQQQSRLE